MGKASRFVFICCFFVLNAILHVFLSFVYSAHGVSIYKMFMKFYSVLQGKLVKSLDFISFP